MSKINLIKNLYVENIYYREISHEVIYKSFRVLDFLGFGKLLKCCFGGVTGCCDESC